MLVIFFSFVAAILSDLQYCDLSLFFDKCLKLWRIGLVVASSGQMMVEITFIWANCLWLEFVYLQNITKNLLKLQNLTLLKMTFLRHLHVIFDFLIIVNFGG